MSIKREVTTKKAWTTTKFDMVYDTTDGWNEYKFADPARGVYEEYSRKDLEDLVEFLQVVLAETPGKQTRSRRAKK